ncbi:hypothetical protein Zmor_000294 [Zophobas morio]|uniref:Uncharacterized protein n=1 Tax=Zophobas morio TaxID=2755281 RepID=A0AA38MRL7_9CUCU|nr:hypothetical protein Zmor_000294 [Zophobas morio]
MAVACRSSSTRFFEITTNSAITVKNDTVSASSTGSRYVAVNFELNYWETSKQLVCIVSSSEYELCDPASNNTACNSFQLGKNLLRGFTPRLRELESADGVENPSAKNPKSNCSRVPDNYRYEVFARNFSPICI